MLSICEGFVHLFLFHFCFFFSLSPGYEVIKVNATDIDEPNNDNSDIRYFIEDQDPKLPSDNLFGINEINGVIRVKAPGLDREVKLWNIFDPSFTLDSCFCTPHIFKWTFSIPIFLNVLLYSVKWQHVQSFQSMCSTHCVSLQTEIPKVHSDSKSSWHEGKWVGIKSEGHPYCYG